MSDIQLVIIPGILAIISITLSMIGIYKGRGIYFALSMLSLIIGLTMFSYYEHNQDVLTKTEIEQCQTFDELKVILIKQIGK
jgi:hypothetical protein